MNRHGIAWPRILEAVAVILLLGLHGGLAISSARDKSATFDEIAHLGGGYLQAMTGDYRFNAESGTLPQRWAALPLTTSGLGVPPADHPALRGANVWLLGRELLYGQSRDADRLLAEARGMIVIVSLALGGLIFAWSRACYGPASGLLSLGLYAFSPTILAHSRWVTADLTAAFFFLLSVWALWRLLQQVTPARLAVAALATSGLLLSKMSGLLILPMAAIMIAVRLADGSPLTLVGWSARHREVAPLGRRLAVIGALIIAVGFSTVGVVWSAYGWRYPARPDAPPEGSEFLHDFDSLLERAGPPGFLLSVAREARLLPEAYLWGLAYTFDTTRERDAFLRGRTSRGGWWWFFPYAVAIKTPLALFGLLGLAVAAWRTTAVTSRAPYIPLWILLAIYSLAAISSHLNIGHRHMLPIYPVLFIFAGAAGHWLSAAMAGGRRRPALAALVVLCLGSFVWESAKIRPHYLSYFNQLVGGPENGYRHLVDSSLDWGQDLPALADYLERRGTSSDNSLGDDPTVYVAYFGAAPPAHYGIDAEWLHSFFPVADPGRPPRPLTGGVYCVSATLLQSMHLELPAWGAPQEEAFRQRRRQVEELFRDAGVEHSRADRSRIFQSFHQLRSARLFAFLRQREPDERIGFSIHIYLLSDADIDSALNGPLEPPKSKPPGERSAGGL